MDHLAGMRIADPRRSRDDEPGRSTSRLRRACLAAALGSAAPGCQRTAADVAPPVPVTAPESTSSRFYSVLAPYGEWLDDATYGWVWVPSAKVVGVDFFPYVTGGHWVYTDAGWIFDSDDSWGWAPYHYGRWAFDAGVGWMWIPGDVWGPAWVDWRWSDGYVGWAPLPPVVAEGGRVSMEPQRSHWVVVAARDLTRPQLQGHLQPRSQVEHVFAVGAAHPTEEPGWRRGPPGALIEAATGERLTPVHLSEPRAEGIVRSHIESGAVRHTPYVESKQPPPPSAFSHEPPMLPVHRMHPHAMQAAVYAPPLAEGRRGRAR